MHNPLNEFRAIGKGEYRFHLSIKVKAAIVIGLLSAILSCSLLTSERQAALYKSGEYYNYIQPTFDNYVQATESWLMNNRTYLSNDYKKERLMNMPFSLGNKEDNNKAILLVHGLGDSPYSFSDLAKTLHRQGFHVQVILLPGHGSKPQDLMLPSYDDWQEVVDHYANILKKDFSTVWLGGYSTGGNLVTIHTMENKGIDGLLLFAPGFQSNIPIIERFARVASLFVDGYEREEVNLARYSSSTIQGGIAYADSAFKLRALLDDRIIKVPTLAVLSEADSAINSASVKELYLKHFDHPRNQMVWYGNAHLAHESVQYLSMQLKKERISTGSHMSPLFAPDNPYYGVNGERRMCETTFKKQKSLRCIKNKDVWFGAWGYKEEGKTHTRLTWNPYYLKLEKEIEKITQ